MSFVQGMKIPEDHILVVSPAVAHKLDNVYTEPEKYDPERFAEPRMEDKKNGPFAFISFGGVCARAPPEAPPSRQFMKGHSRGKKKVPPWRRDNSKIREQRG